MPVKTSQMRRFTAARGGNVAMIYALTVLALFAIAGVAIDYSRGVGAKKGLQVAIDTASLTGARMLEDASLTDAEIRAEVEAVFHTNLLTSDGGFDCPAADVNVTIDRPNGVVRVAADCDLETTLAAVMRVEQIDIGAKAAAKANMTRLDVAFSFDVSGSMGDPSSSGTGTKLDDLKAAAREAADILVTPATGDRVRLAFNTYSTSVNAGAFANTVLGRDEDYVGNTCVSERDGVAKWRDDAPEAGKWMGDAASSCPASSVLPLTDKADTFKTAIGKLTASGYTAGHIGVAWSWYLISPDWDDVWPADSRPLGYGEPETMKAVILMTDGKFNTEYLPNTKIGNGNPNPEAKKLCKKMRETGVIVYSIALQAPVSAQLTLKDCAGGDDNFFNASNATELKAAYREIASRLTRLHLSE